MGTFWVKDFPQVKWAPRPPELPWEPFALWLAFVFVWAASGWLAHAYMMHDLRKQRLLNKSDHDLVWTCMVVAPLAVFIAFLMFITPDDRKKDVP